MRNNHRFLLYPLNPYHFCFLKQAKPSFEAHSLWQFSNSFPRLYLAPNRGAYSHCTHTKNLSYCSFHLSLTHSVAVLWFIFSIPRYCYCDAFTCIMINCNMCAVVVTPACLVRSCSVDAQRYARRTSGKPMSHVDW